MKHKDLDGLPAFVAVATEKSFTVAAARLGVTAPAVSQAVKLLEERLGAPLFYRTTRSVALTEVGERYLARVRPALAQIAAAAELVGDYAGLPKGLLRLTVPRIVYVALVEPRLSEFLAAYPNIELDVSIDDNVVDIIGNGFDAGIRLHQWVERDMVAAPLLTPAQSTIVGSPDYLDHFGVPERVEDLKDHRCIRQRFAANKEIYRWPLRIGGKEIRFEPAGPLTLNENSAAVAAAVRGVGLAFTLEAAVTDHLSSARLRKVLPKACVQWPGVYLSYPSRAHSPLKLRAFKTFFSSLGER